jgi:hypothetical protein
VKRSSPVAGDVPSEVVTVTCTWPCPGGVLTSISVSDVAVAPIRFTSNSTKNVLFAKPDRRDRDRLR